MQQQGLEPDGLLKYVQSNPVKFTDHSEVAAKVVELARKKEWKKEYSRQLRPDPDLVPPTGFLPYGDHMGSACQKIWKAKITNKRKDATAQRAVCILDWVKGPDGAPLPSRDRTYLKWAGRREGYDQTILPDDFGEVDVFATRHDREGIFLHSQCDVGPTREPIWKGSGKCELHYKLFAQGFPMCTFKIRVKLGADFEGVLVTPTVECSDPDKRPSQLSPGGILQEET